MDDHESPKKGTPWFKIGCGCLLLLILLMGGCLYGVFSLIKGSDPYRYALETARSSPVVVEAVGQPVEAGLLVAGNINLQNDDGQADMRFEISGPDGSGTLHVVGIKTDGAWDYSVLDFTPADGSTTVSLLTGEERQSDGASGDDASSAPPELPTDESE